VTATKLAGGRKVLQDEPWIPARLAHSRGRVWVYVVVGLVAFAARAYLLRFAQLTGEGNYDDAVHFSGSLALVLGKLPFRDFLFLHPPAIMLALSPFAGLAQVTSDSFGFAVARIAWMLLGAFNAVAVARLLRPLGLLSALIGGLAYALYFPAVYAESTTMLEGLANTLLLAALLLLAKGRSPSRLVWAGILLGLVPAVKIWGVVLLAAVLVWVLISRGLRPFLTVLVAAAASCAAVVGPFFLAAPANMWQMVVAAQLGRPDMTSATTETRLWQMLGLYGQPADSQLTYALVGAAIVIAAVSVWRNRTFSLAWLAVGLFIPASAMLVMTPSFYQHYPAVIAVPFALILGAAVSMAPMPGHRLRWLGALAVLPLVLAWGTAQDLHDAQSYTGRDIQFTTLRAAVTSAAGCVTSDDPAPLIELNVFSRNVERGCPVWIDLTGHSYVDDIGGHIPRAQNAAFQHQAISYLSSGDVAIIGRNPSLHYLDAASRATVKHWPVLATSDIYTAYQVTR
jgi:alpha-1,2-mannosyltransferase